MRGEEVEKSEGGIGRREMNGGAQAGKRARKVGEENSEWRRWN